MMSTKKREVGQKVSVRVMQYVALIFFASLVAFPFLIILMTSFQTEWDALSVPFRFIGESGLSVQGYTETIAYGRLMSGFLNTMITSLLPTLVCLLVSSLAAFAYAKLRWRLREAFFAIIIFTMMIPGTILLVPQYMVFNWLGWTDIGSAANFLPLIVPQLFGAGSIIFFLRQFLYGVPDSLIEAGRIDGLSYPGAFFYIVCPLLVPAFLAQGLLHFISLYNAYLGPMLYLKTEDFYTLQLVASTFKDFVGTNYPAQMACSLLTLLPVLVLYIVFQRYFVEGISTSGMKL